MLGKTIAKIKYLLPVYEGKTCSPGSLKLDLRNASKTYVRHLYFKEISKTTVGRALYGTPDLKGLFTMEILDENKKSALIKIGLDKQMLTLYNEEEIDDIVTLLETSLTILENKGIVEILEFEKGDEK